MPFLKSMASVMDNVTAYRLWQAPFLRAKFAPILRENDLAQGRSVLDVGCGPGTNCDYFKRSRYLGVDINEMYIDYALRRYRRDFRVADVRTFTVPQEDRFDFVLLNSLLHHIDEENTRRILAQLRSVLTDDGHIHIVELVLPSQVGVPRFLARSDRGDYPRTLTAWEAIFSAYFEPVVFEPFSVGLLGAPLWDLVYFKGRAKA